MEIYTEYEAETTYHILFPQPGVKVDPADLGATFRQLRKQQQATLRTVSKMTGFSVSYLSDLERGRTVPSLSTVIKLADYYGYALKLRLEERREGGDAGN